MVIIITRQEFGNMTGLATCQTRISYVECTNATVAALVIVRLGVNIESIVARFNGDTVISQQLIITTAINPADPNKLAIGGIPHIEVHRSGVILAKIRIWCCHL